MREAADMSALELRELLGTLPDDVDGQELLDDLRTFITRFVILPSEEAADLMALWALHTHAIDAAHATPYLRITSATPECGKTLLLEVLEPLCRNGWRAVGPSLAVLFRKVAAASPTLLWDEFDRYGLDDKSEVIGLLNAGYKRGGTYPRCVGEGTRQEIHEFPVFCPKAFAGIDAKALDPALLSRCITIRMEKKLRAEKPERFLPRFVSDEAEELYVRCQLWAQAHADTLTDHVPDDLGLDGRAYEVWSILLSIAELAGETWYARARAAVEWFGTGGDEGDEIDHRVLLLADIRDAFGEDRTIASTALCNKLNAIEEAPWGEVHGRGIDPRTLARRLSDFTIRSKTVQIGEGKTLKGYHRDDFADAWLRHLNLPSQASQASHPASGLEPDVTDVTDVTLVSEGEQ